MNILEIQEQRRELENKAGEPGWIFLGGMILGALCCTVWYKPWWLSLIMFVVALLMLKVGFDSINFYTSYFHKEELEKLEAMEKELLEDYNENSNLGQHSL